MKARRRRQGATLVEALVAIAILALLAGLAVVGIGAARRSQQQLTCMHQLRGLHAAISAYVDTYGRTPPLFRTNEGKGWLRVLPFMDGAPAGAPATVPRAFSPGGYEFQLANPEYVRRFNALFLCPASSLDEAPPTSPVVGPNNEMELFPLPGRCSYSMNAGLSSDLGPFDSAGPFTYEGEKLSAIANGLSHTAFVSEVVAMKSTAPDEPLAGAGAVVPISSSGPTYREFLRDCLAWDPATRLGPYKWLGESWAESTAFSTVYSHALAPGNVSCEQFGSYSIRGNSWDVATAGSAHAGIVNVVFGDGSGRVVGNAIDAQVWRNMGVRAGNGDIP